MISDALAPFLVSELVWRVLSWLSRGTARNQKDHFEQLKWRIVMQSFLHGSGNERWFLTTARPNYTAKPHVYLANLINK